MKGEKMAKQIKKWYVKFCPRDWQGDIELQSCSLAARGLWIELLCVATSATPYGYFSANGKAIKPEILARLTGCTIEEFDKAFSELEKQGVVRFDAGRGCYFSKRLVEDYRKSAEARAHGKKGGNPALMKRKEKTTQPEEPEPYQPEPTAAPITLAEALQHADRIGLKKEQAEACYTYYESQDWRTKEGWIMSKRAALAKIRYWKVNQHKHETMQEERETRIEANKAIARDRSRKKKPVSVHTTDGNEGVYKLEGEE